MKFIQARGVRGIDEDDRCSIHETTCRDGSLLCIFNRRVCSAGAGATLRSHACWWRLLSGKRNASAKPEPHADTYFDRVTQWFTLPARCPSPLTEFFSFSHELRAPLRRVRQSLPRCNRRMQRLWPPCPLKKICSPGLVIGSIPDQT